MGMASSFRAGSSLQLVAQPIIQADRFIMEMLIGQH